MSSYFLIGKSERSAWRDIIDNQGFLNLMATELCMINEADVESRYVFALPPRGRIPDNQQKDYT
jgi:hypothetical protein